MFRIVHVPIDNDVNPSEVIIPMSTAKDWEGTVEASNGPHGPTWTEKRARVQVEASMDEVDRMVPVSSQVWEPKTLATVLLSGTLERA
jgi:hypothetical protein